MNRREMDWELLRNTRHAKIAVLRASGVRDFLLSLPALEALRAAFPQAEIVLLGQPWQRAFLTGRPSPIDRVAVIPRVRGVTAPLDFDEDPAVLEPFFAEMQQEGFRLAIQLHGPGQYENPLVCKLGARWNIGLKSPEAASLDGWLPYVEAQSESHRCLEVVGLTGAKPVGLEPRVTLIPDDRREADRLLEGDTRPIVVLHPGASDPRRRWGVEKFAAVGDALAGVGARVVLIGTDLDRRRVRLVQEQMSSPALNLCERLSLGGLAGLLSRSALIVGNDSGPLHLASAVGTSAVGIYWCANLTAAGPIFCRRHRAHVSWRLVCPACGHDGTRGHCGHGVSMVDDVAVEDVLGSALELLPTASLMPTPAAPLVSPSSAAAATSAAPSSSAPSPVVDLPPISGLGSHDLAMP